MVVKLGNLYRLVRGRARQGAKVTANLNESTFLRLLNRTLDDIEVWEDVLEFLCKETGAKKAIITTREVPSAEIVISEAISQMNQSPLLYGLSNEEIESYVIDYHEDDIWTKVENERRPYAPYSLAQHLPMSELKKSKLWNWLEPQGISDTIVAEVFSSPSHWIALNVYYDHADKPTRRNIFNFLSSFLPDIQRVWRLGQDIRSAQTLLSSGGVLIEHYDFAAILISPPSKILWINDKALSVLDQHNIGRVENGELRLRNLTEKKWIKSHTTALFNQNNLSAIAEDMTYSMRSKLSNVEFKLSRVAKFDSVLGIGSPVFLVSLYPGGVVPQTTLAGMLGAADLTKTEKALVRHLSNGHSIKSFGEATGTSEHNARFHWKNIKRKLGLHSPKQIFDLNRERH